MNKGRIELLRWLLACAFRAQPGKWIVAGLTIAIGTSLAVAIHTVNKSALGEFNRAIDVVNGQASAQVIAPWGEFDDELFDRIFKNRRALGLDAVSPVLLIKANEITVVGLDLFQAARATPSLMPVADRTEHLFASDSIFLSAAARSELGVGMGDAITLTAGTQKISLRVAGSVPGVSGQAIAVMDLGLAQWRFDRLGKLTRLDVRLSSGADAKAFADALAKIDPRLQVVLADDRERRMSNLSRAYRVNLTVLALVALFTGAFLVFTAVGFSVLRQQTQFALLSVLGASRRWLMSLILMQGMLVALLGGLLGLFAGWGLAVLLLNTVGGDLGAGFFAKTNLQVQIDVVSYLGFWLIAIAVGFLASYFPARAAIQHKAADQLRLGASERALQRLTRPWLSLSLCLIAFGLAFFPALGGLPIAAYLSIAFILLAGISATPWLVRWVFSFLGNRVWPRSYLTLAFWRLGQAPVSAAGLISGVVAAVSLTVAMVIMVASFRDSVSLWLYRILPADLYSSSQSMMNQPGFSRQTKEKVFAVEGVARAELNHHQPLTMRPDWPEVMLIARSIPKTDPAAVIPLTGSLFRSDRYINVYISEAMADLYGHKPGALISLPLTRPATVWVAGIYRDYGRQHGSIAIDSSDYIELTGDKRQTGFAIWLKDGAKPDQVIAKIRSTVPELDQVKFMSTADIRALSLKIFDRSFTLTYALEFAALLVAIFSVATGFAGQALLRQKEFALLAHLGQSKKERTKTIGMESSWLLGLGVAWGALLGLVMSQLLIHRVNPQSFHWTMDTSLPLGAIAALGIGVLAIGVFSSLAAANQGFKEGQFKRALQQDW